MVQVHELESIFDWPVYLTSIESVEYGKVVVIPRYPIGLGLIVGRYQQKLQHILLQQPVLYYLTVFYYLSMIFAYLFQLSLESQKVP